MRSACEIPAFPSILPQHLQQQRIFVQSNNFHNTLPGNQYKFSLALKGKKKHRELQFWKNSGKRKRFHVKYSSISNHQANKPGDRSILPLMHMWFQENFTNKPSYRWRRKNKPKTTRKDLEVISGTSCKLEKGETLGIHIQKKCPETCSHSFSIVQNTPQCAWSICVQALENSHSRNTSNFSLLTSWLLITHLVQPQECVQTILYTTAAFSMAWYHELFHFLSSISLPGEATGKETMLSTASHQVRTLLTGLMPWKLLLLLRILIQAMWINWSFQFQIAVQNLLALHPPPKRWRKEV